MSCPLIHGGILYVGLDLRSLTIRDSSVCILLIEAVRRPRVFIRTGSGAPQSQGRIRGRESFSSQEAVLRGWPRGRTVDSRPRVWTIRSHHGSLP